jgi:hypothetical protein
MQLGKKGGLEKKTEEHPMDKTVRLFSEHLPYIDNSKQSTLVAPMEDSDHGFCPGLVPDGAKHRACGGQLMHAGIVKDGRGKIARLIAGQGFPLPVMTFQCLKPDCDNSETIYVQPLIRNPEL